MLKTEFLRNPDVSFLIDVPLQLVVISDSVIQDGVEMRRDILIPETRRLHQSLQARRYQNPKSEFEGFRVVTLDDALTGLFRAHPYSGEPIDDSNDPFHHTQMSEEEFLAFLFLQEDGYFTKGSVGGFVQNQELAHFNGSPDLIKQSLERIERASAASSLKSKDATLLVQAKARIWFNNPNYSAAPPSLINKVTYVPSDQLLFVVLSKLFNQQEFLDLASELDVYVATGSPSAMARDLIDSARRYIRLDKLYVLIKERRGLDVNPHLYELLASNLNRQQAVQLGHTLKLQGFNESTLIGWDNDLYGRREKLKVVQAHFANQNEWPVFLAAIKRCNPSIDLSAFE